MCDRKDSSLAWNRYIFPEILEYFTVVCRVLCWNFMSLVHAVVTYVLLIFRSDEFIDGSLPMHYSACSFSQYGSAVDLL